MQSFLISPTGMKLVCYGTHTHTDTWLGVYACTLHQIILLLQRQW